MMSFRCSCGRARQIMQHGLQERGLSWGTYLEIMSMIDKLSRCETEGESRNKRRSWGPPAIEKKKRNKEKRL